MTEMGEQKQALVVSRKVVSINMKKCTKTGGIQTGVPKPEYSDRGTQTKVPRPGYPDREYPDGGFSDQGGFKTILSLYMIL